MNPKITLKILKSNGKYTPAYIVKTQGRILFTKKEHLSFLNKKDAIYFGKYTIQEAIQIGFLPV